MTEGVGTAASEVGRRSSLEISSVFDILSWRFLWDIHVEMGMRRLGMCISLRRGLRLDTEVSGVLAGKERSLPSGDVVREEGNLERLASEEHGGSQRGAMLPQAAKGLLWQIEKRFSFVDLKNSHSFCREGQKHERTRTLF